MSDIKKIKAAELKPDLHNANRGTERGRYAIETSLREYGAGRSILVDKNGVIIAGNKTLETAAEIGLDDVVLVQTNGKQIVAVQRTDLDLLTDEKARMLAYADNRVSELDLSFDPYVIADDLESGLDLSVLWFDNELEDLVFESESTALADAPESSDRKLGEKSKQIKPVLYADEVAIFEKAIRETGNKNRGEALIQICRFYLEKNEKGQFYSYAEGIIAA